MYLRQTFIIFALLVLRQLARSQRTRTQRLQASWGGWTMWSMCTTTAGDGVRIRSRSCREESCDNLPGKNYEIQTCSVQAIPEEMQNNTYLERCTNDPNMNSTLSCRLYRENPIMAYGIFRSAGHMHCNNHNKQSSGKQRSSCIFNVIGDAPDFGEVESAGPDQQQLVFGRPPNTRAGEVGLEFLNQLNTTPLPSGRLNEASSERETQYPSLAQNTAESAPTNDICAATCERLVLQGTQVSQLGKNAPSSVQELLQFLAGNIFFRDNRPTILTAYDSCLTTCRASSNPVEYTEFRDTLVHLGLDPTQQNPDMIVSKIQPSQGMAASRNRRNSPEQNVSYPQYPDYPSNSNSSAVHSMHARLVKRILLLNKQVTTPSFYRRLIELSKEHNIRTNAQSRGQFVPPKSPSPTNPSTISIQLEASNNTDKREGGNWTTDPLATTSMPINNETVLRYKRQLNPYLSRPNPDNFRSPCYERVEEMGNPRVLNLDDTEGELFFYEGREQRFIRRRCVGRSLVPGKLYRAQEPVRQERTQMLAVCKQGFLVRYGLIIQLDRKGEFAFNDGERFSIRFQPFKLESHCALSVAN